MIMPFECFPSDFFRLFSSFGCLDGKNDDGLFMTLCYITPRLLLLFKQSSTCVNVIWRKNVSLIRCFVYVSNLYWIVNEGEREGKK